VEACVRAMEDTSPYASERARSFKRTDAKLSPKTKKWCQLIHGARCNLEHRLLHDTVQTIGAHELKIKVTINKKVIKQKFPP
jgi:hypothetical protein